MFQFAYPERLYLLLLIPFLVIIYIISVRIKRRKETYLAERPLFRQSTASTITLATSQEKRFHRQKTAGFLQISQKLKAKQAGLFLLQT